jgi:CPA2 family monovalent cation:H+ antiporter-2
MHRSLLPSVAAESSLDFLLTLAAAFVVAFAGGAIAMRLKQSPIVGYLVAGLLIGPFTPGFTADAETTQRFADIGVILLLFGVGVHFSLGELVRLKVVAGGGGLAQVVLTIGIGMLAGTALGWSPLASFFLGATVAISSSAVLAKVLEERGEEGSAHGTIALAWMVVQDLATIVLVVLLTGLSGSSGDLKTGVALATAKAALFVAVLLVVGTRLLPWALDRVAALNSRELFLIAIAALSLGTAYLAEQVGISLALGAFLAGLVVSESDLAHHILGEIGPLRDLFAVLFFVSIGMLVDPAVVLQALPAFALIVALIVLAKGALSSGIILALRYPARTGLLAGAGIAQAGEFSFLLARIGRDADVLNADRFTLILGACTASIIVGPALFPLLERVAVRLESRWVNRPSYSTDAIASTIFWDHIVICGYGRVGSVAARVLREWGIPVVVVEQNRNIVNDLRAAGYPVVFGNAANPHVLGAAGIRRAQGIVVALPDPLDARRVLDQVRRERTDADIIVRAHSDAEQATLLARGATEVVIAEEELALEMVHHMLHRHGADDAAIDAMLAAARHGPSDGASFPDAGVTRGDEPSAPAPVTVEDDPR